MRRLLFTAVVLAALGCAHRGGAVRFGREGQLEVIDTLPALAGQLRLSAANVPEGAMAAWTAYEAKHRRVLAAAGALEDDPGDQKLRKLAVSPDAVAAVLESFQAAAAGELESLAGLMNEKLGGPPALVLALCALRSDRPLFHGTLPDGREVLVVNARHPELTAPEFRQAMLARELFAAAHRQRQPDSPSLGPLAKKLHREGASLLAVRQLVPRALEHQIIGIEERDLARLRGREPLVAKELLASLDSARPSEAARFFDPKVKDPLVPSGAGLYVADRLFQRLAAELGSTTRPLEMSQADFLPRARQHLIDIASASSRSP